MISQVLQKAQEAAHQESSVVSVMSALENLNPEVKKILDGNEQWQAMKNKSMEEVEKSATNLLNDKNIVSSVVGSINPEYGDKIKNNVIFNAIGNRSPADMGKFIIKTGRLLGIIKS